MNNVKYFENYYYFIFKLLGSKWKIQINFEFFYLLKLSMPSVWHLDNGTKVYFKLNQSLLGALKVVFCAYLSRKSTRNADGHCDLFAWHGRSLQDRPVCVYADAAHHQPI